MKAHDLAKKLLAGPDVEVRFQDEESAYSGFVEDVDKNLGTFCEVSDYPEEADDQDEDEFEDSIPWEDCITLSVGSTDGILCGDSIIEH